MNQAIEVKISTSGFGAFLLESAEKGDLVTGSAFSVSVVFLIDC